MARKFNQPLSVILIGFCLLLGGAAGAGNAAEPVIINRLAVVHLDGSAGDLQPGQPLQIQFSLSLTASATLTLDQPEGVLAMFVNLTLQGSATYCTEFVPTTPGPHTFRLEATDGTTSDAATRAYDVGPHDDPRRPAKIELLTTSRGRDSASYVAGETVRVFFRVDNDAMATLGLERSDLSSGQLVFRDFPLPGGQTYHVDLLADAQGSWVLRLTALAATTEEQTCAFMVGPAPPPPTGPPPPSSAHGGSLQLSAALDPSSGVDSGIDVRSGEQVTVTATGLATYGYDTAPYDSGFWQTDPSGQLRLAGGKCWLRSDPRATLPTAPIGMLIGRIGAGAWFPLGGNGTWTARESGRLYLLYNDAAGRYSDNSGGYQVEVEVVSAGGQ